MIFTQEKIKIGVYVYQEMELQDFSGPIDVFVKANRFVENHYQIVLFAKDNKNIETEGKTVSITAQYTFETLPQVDMIIIPGAPLEVVTKLSDEEAVQNFLISRKEQGTTMASVCTGAFVLSKAGLLDGHRFTTHYLAASKLQEYTPKGKLVKNVRFVASEKVLTASGITSGIDFALYVVGKHSGAKVQAQVTNLMQHNYKIEEEWPKP